LNFTQPGSIIIADYYALGSTIDYSGGGNLHIENFWVTTDTWKGGTTIQLSNGSTATIGTYILQVGSSLISINGVDHPFGNEDEQYDTVAMNATTFRTKHVIKATVADGHFITNSTDDAPPGDERLNAAPGHANNPYGAGIGPFVDGAYQGSYRLENYAAVGFVDVRNGSVNNYASSTIEALLLHYNHYRNTSGRVVDNNMGQVDVATVVTGILNNRDGGNIDYLGMRNTVANRQDPAVVNNNSTIGSAMVNYGILNNEGGGEIESLAIFADDDGRTGTVNNSGSVGNLTYTAGKFAGKDGTIGNLTIAGDSTGIQWGTVGNLSFSNDGSGILTVKGYANAAGGFDAGFKELNGVNLTGAKLVIEILDTPTGNLNIDWATLLGLTNNATIAGWGSIDTLTIGWGTEWNAIWDVNKGGLLDPLCQINATGITLTVSGRLAQPATFTTGTPAPSEGVDTWQVALNWSQVNEATGYQIRYQMTKDATGAVVPSPTWLVWNNSITTPLTGTTTTVTGLVLDATYSFEIVAVSTDVTHTPSSAKVITVAIVRDVWQTNAAGTDYSGKAYGNVGGTDGTAKFNGTGAKTIANFYTMGANLQHTATESDDSLHIENYWVTTSTFGQSNGLGNNILDFTSVTIGNYVVQVGQRNVDVDGESRMFGTSDDNYLNSISPQANNIRTATTVVEIADQHFITNGISDQNVDPVNRVGSHGNNLYNATWDWCYVENYGTIGLVDMRNGFANNRAGGTIEALLLHHNYTANNPEGLVNNWGQVDVATVRNATLNNNGGGSIDFLGMRAGSSDTAIPAGVVNNTGKVGSAAVNWGTLNNDVGGEIESLAIFADSSERTGIVNNSGSIGNLTYTAGNFVGNGGTIGNLTIAGDSTVTQWGTVDNLSFVSDGSGVLTIQGTADGAGGFEFDAGFQKLSGANLTGAKLVIDLRGISTGGLTFDKALENINWAALLGLTDSATVTGWGNIDNITIGWGTEWSTVWDLSQGGALNPNWKIDGTGITF
jgi:hypothetical protein